ncbi:hypothetical protein F2Q68_00016737 [Brassica cretica]|uniref:Uncharacterized protein n=1 Tax=Brassica cretica TaxID=69181 RepID=A0A8S9HJH4_BRACR|nr:hypothetical protein F2Q68_00016737 [Brassica cretica]
MNLLFADNRSEEMSLMQLVERDEMDEDDDLFEAIDKLIAQGINSGDVKKLQDDRIHTCNGLMMHTKKVKTDTPMQVYYSKKKQGKRVLEAEEVPSQGDEAGTSNG